MCLSGTQLKLHRNFKSEIIQGHTQLNRKYICNFSALNDDNFKSELLPERSLSFPLLFQLFHTSTYLAKSARKTKTKQRYTLHPVSVLIISKVDHNLQSLRTHCSLLCSTGTLRPSFVPTKTSSLDGLLWPNSYISIWLGLFNMSARVCKVVLG